MKTFNEKYELGKIIGRGATSTVWSARELALDREVALKILHAAHLKDEDKERFYREARTAAKLKHRNIATVFTLEESEDGPYIVMELLKGADLEVHINEKRPLTLAQKLELFAQVCDGLAFAHGRGIVHRDIKPSNVFVQENLVPKILDFGVARLPASNLTLTGHFVGTLSYMSPEQIDSRSCTDKSDIFSAAIVLHHCLTHKHPFQSSSIQHRIASGEPESLHSDPLVPGMLADLILRALQKRPEERVASAERFARDLRSIAEDLRQDLAIERDVPETRVAGEPVSQAAAPVLDERFAFLTKLVTEFNLAMAAGDPRLASDKLVQLQRVGGQDVRVAQTVRDCEVRFEQLHPQAKNVARAATAADGGAISDEPWDDTARFFRGAVTPAGPFQEAETPKPKPCSRCAQPNRPTATFCASCGTSLSLAIPQEPENSIAASQNVVLAAKAYLARLYDSAIVSMPSVRDLTRAAVGWIGMVPRAAIVITAIATVLAASLMLFLFRPNQPVPVIPIEKAVGTAHVRVSTDVLSSLGSDRQLMLTLQPGSTVNILAPIERHNQEYIYVQHAPPGRTRPPGFARIADLDTWVARTSDIGWTFLRYRKPAAGIPMEFVRQFQQDLNAYLRRFPYTKFGDAARVLLIQAHLDLALYAKNAGTPQSQWQPDIDEAEALLSRFVKPLDEAEEIKKKLNALEAPDPARPAQPPDAATPPPMPQVRQVKVWEARAKELLETGDLDGAVVIAKDIVRVDPKNAVAKSVLEEGLRRDLIDVTKETGK